MGMIFMLLLSTMLYSTVVLSGFPASLTLERAFPVSGKFDLDHMRARDMLRHGRLLQSSGLVDFAVGGTFNPYLVGLYFTTVKLGTPAREFYVQIDTGSDVLWVNCNPCNGCPQSTGLPIQLSFFDPASSSTASLISCSDQRCSMGIQYSDSSCSTKNNQCEYTFQYGDGSGTTGLYVSDVLHLNVIIENSLTTNSSASIVFGCSMTQTGDLTKSDRAVDGILGLGQTQGMSMISQLSSEGITPNIFSHCLRGDEQGGGILVFGEIVDSNLVYSPLVPSQPHYNLNLQSIAVNGQKLSIDPSIFATSSNQGTIVDTGTTLAYLADEAYDLFINAFENFLSQGSSPVISKGKNCYVITSSVNDVFPSVTLNFAGDAAMFLKPTDYLIRPPNPIGVEWCLGFQKIQGQKMTIIGDVILKDKIFVYDLANQRIGWASYDCSTSVNVSTSNNTTGRSEFVNASQINTNASPESHVFGMLIPTFFAVVLVHIFIFRQ